MTTWERAAALGLAGICMLAGCKEDPNAAPKTEYEQAAERAGVDYPPAQPAETAPPADTQANAEEPAVLMMEPIEIVGRVPAPGEEPQEGVGGSGSADEQGTGANEAMGGSGPSETAPTKADGGVGKLEPASPGTGGSGASVREDRSELNLPGGTSAEEE